MIYPGVYDVDTTQLQIQPWLAVMGMEKKTTIIRGIGTQGIVKVFPNTSLTNLTIEGNESSTTGINIASYPSAGFARLENLMIHITGESGLNSGIYVISSAKLFDVDIFASGGNSSIGILFEGSQSLTFNRGSIHASGADINYGVWHRGVGNAELYDTNIKIDGSDQSFGVNIPYSGSILLSGVDMEMTNINRNGYGFLVVSSDVIIEHSRITVYGGSIAEVLNASRMNIFDSHLESRPVPDTQVAGFRLSGGTTSTRIMNINNSVISAYSYYDGSVAIFANGETTTVNIGASTVTGYTQQNNGSTVNCAGIYEAGNYSFGTYYEIGIFHTNTCTSSGIVGGVAVSQ